MQLKLKNLFLKYFSFKSILLEHYSHLVFVLLSLSNNLTLQKKTFLTIHKSHIPRDTL